ncbi:MAG: dUTP diphosphatase [Thermodesulfobacteriota bacterium]|nr:dUTP diphosphatase [Thermodesulfobacteriota bacterium]
MSKVILKVKRLDNNKNLPLPSYQTNDSSGLDLRAALEKDIILHPGDIKLIPTGLSISIPKGYEVQVRPRSGLALKHGIGIVNSPGTIDADYRGEIGIIAINWGEKSFTVKRGDRIAQIVVNRVSHAVVEEVDGLDQTDRGEGGFGHSGT